MNNSMILSKTSSLEYDDICLNKNICVIGSPGSGKTHSFVKPNILAMAEAGHSMVISETKGNLSKKFGKYLEEQGYDVKVFDLINTDKSISYEPFDYIENEKDVLTFSKILVKDSHSRDPFWDNMARFYIQALTAYICLEDCIYPRRLETMLDLFSKETFTTNKRLGYREKSNVESLFENVREKNPSSFAVRAYNYYSKVRGSDVTDSSILSSVSEKLMPFTSKAVLRLFDKNEFDFRTIGEKKTAVFVNISDNDRSMDMVASLFFTQMLNILIRHADEDFEDSRLPVPVDFIIDDFGTQTVIPDFDKMIASIRSRNISVSIILQSVNQLKSAYYDAASTIIACCDTQLYFGGSDLETIEYASKRADLSETEIMNMPRWKVWVFRRCMEPSLDDCFRFEEHPAYKFTGECDKEKLFVPPERKIIAAEKKVTVSDDEILSFDRFLEMDDFSSIMNSLLKERLGLDLRIYASEYNPGCVCYSVLMYQRPDYYLCLFERRKQLLDELYYKTYIMPILGKLNYQPKYTMLVSYSGFTNEEICFANKVNICLIDRKGFTSGEGNIILNIYKFSDLLAQAEKKEKVHNRPKISELFQS